MPTYADVKAPPNCGNFNFAQQQAAAGVCSSELAYADVC
jgi:hypothetical protein